MVLILLFGTEKIQYYEIVHSIYLNFIFNFFL